MHRQMQKVLVSFDPLILDSVDRMAKDRHQTRSELLRDIIYTVIWQEKKTGKRVTLRRAPLLPKREVDYSSESRLIRILHEGYQSVEVDKDGLAIDPPKVHTPWGMQD